MALYFGKHASTNNEAEAEALLNALRWVIDCDEPAEQVVVKGDSYLVIQFMNRLCNPRVKSLVDRISEGQRLRKKCARPVHIIHIAREYN